MSDVTDLTDSQLNLEVMRRQCARDDHPMAESIRNGLGEFLYGVCECGRARYSRGVAS